MLLIKRLLHTSLFLILFLMALMIFSVPEISTGSVFLIPFPRVTIISELQVTATVYHAVRKETDSTPNITADNLNLKNIDIKKYRVLSVSNDLLKNKKYFYGDSLWISGTDNLDGWWIVHDTMNKRFKNRIDLLVPKEIKSGKWKVIMTKFKVENR